MFLFVLAGGLPGPTAATAADNPGFVTVEASTKTATVKDIDYQARTVTLAWDTGAVETVKVSDEARNFNQIRKGDEVTVELYETVSVEVRKEPGEPVAVESETTTRALPGQKPKGMRVTEGIRTARVEDIDYQARTVTLRDDKGNLKTYKVDEGARRFNEVKKGNMVIRQYVRTVAVSVKKPEKK
jgi:Cu/Ag efflux protein CusF